MSCVICMNKIKGRVTLNCSHTFCKSCIYEWTKLNNTCPTCRTTVIKHKHNYNTRSKNNKIFIIKLNNMINEYNDRFRLHTYINVVDKISYLHNIFFLVKSHKYFLSSNKYFKNIVVNKINELKSQGVSQAYYWDQL